MTFKNKDPFTAFILALIFGPIGYLHFGFKVFLSCVSVSILTFIFGFVVEYPELFLMFTSISYGLHAFKLANYYNKELLRCTEDELPYLRTFLFGFISMDRWLFYYIVGQAIAFGAYYGVTNFEQGRILYGLLSLLVAPFVFYFFCKHTLGYLYSIILGILLENYKEKKGLN